MLPYQRKKGDARKCMMFITILQVQYSLQLYQRYRTESGTIATHSNGRPTCNTETYTYIESGRNHSPS